MNIAKAFVLVACALAVSAGAFAQSAAHEAIKKQLAELRAKPEKAKLPEYLPESEDFDDVCQRAKKDGKLVFVSIGREICGRCQVFYEYVKRGDVTVDPKKFVFVRLSIDNESQRNYFFSTFSPENSHLPFVGVMNGDREEVLPCLTGSHSAAEYAKLLTDSVSKN